MTIVVSVSTVSVIHRCWYKLKSKTVISDLSEPESANFRLSITTCVRALNGDHVAGSIRASLNPPLRILPRPTYIPPPPPKPPAPLEAAMAAPTVMPQVHDPDRPIPAPCLLSNLGTTHRTRPLLAILGPAGDRAITTPARVLQVRAGFPSLQCL